MCLQLTFPIVVLNGAQRGALYKCHVKKSYSIVSKCYIASKYNTYYVLLLYFEVSLGVWYFNWRVPNVIRSSESWYAWN